MIIELIDKLLDRLIQLVKHRQEVERNVFTNFIEPVFVQFELVHNGYLASFKEYKKTVNEASNFDRMATSLAARVEEDNLFSASEREKLQSLADWEKYGSSAEAGFADAIVSYLLETKADLVGSPSSLRFPSQRWRNNLLHELRGKFSVPENDKDSPDHRKKERLSEIIDDTVEQMQAKYGEVVDRYTELKRRYLDERLGGRTKSRDLRE